jgi:ATP-binding cassette, subfamily C, bacterial PrsD
MSQTNIRSASSPSLSGILAAIPGISGAGMAIILLSALINLLALGSSLYMLQLYDRVLPSHSVPTLLALTVLIFMLYAGFGLFEWVRARIANRLAARLDRMLRPRAFTVVLSLALQSRRGGDGMLPVTDLDRVRSFLGGAGPIALVDLPWTPLYLAIVFLLHPSLGALALAGALLLMILTLLTEVRSRAPVRAVAVSASERSQFLSASRRNSEAVRALGMDATLSERWQELSETHLATHRTASDIAGSQAAVSRVVRLLIQSGVLGLGAFLVIAGEATGGVMIAASILASRALAPIDMTIANWREFVAARQSAARLARFLDAAPPSAPRLELPRPSSTLQVEGLWIAAPGEAAPIVSNISFTLGAGSALGIVGPSASGKSTLVRALVGAWPPLRGTIRLDGASLDQWMPDSLGRHVGYLPQDIELFDGTVAQNIGRFRDVPDSEVIAAAVAADIHDMVVRLREGYDTRIGEGGAALSAGQRQRIGLARALFGSPFLVVLDEPNSNLDAAGDAALTEAIAAAKARGAIVIVVAHRPSALAACDQVLAMANGQAKAFGPKEETLRKVLQDVQPMAGRLKVVAEGTQGTAP